MTDFDDIFTKGGSEEDDFDDFLRWLRPGRKVTAAGTLRYREGGDPRDWAIPGQTKRLAGEWQMQVGSRSWTGSARTSGGMEVTFPARFSGLPLVLVTPINTTPLFEDVRFQSPLASAAGMEIYWFSAVNLTMVTFAWLAIGPIGLG